MRVGRMWLCSHLRHHEEIYSHHCWRWYLPLIFFDIRCYTKNASARCDSPWALALRAAKGRREEWPEITKTRPPRHSDNKEPFWHLFSFHPSLYHCHLISPAVTFIGCLCQRLLVLGSFLLFLLLIYKIRLKNNFKMTRGKKIRP